MSHDLINRNDDLLDLYKEGYDVEIRAEHLVLRDVPYVNKDKEIKRGMLVSELALSNDETVTPPTHTINFAGEQPYDENGNAIEANTHYDPALDIDGVGLVDYQFSYKSNGNDYKDYFEKMCHYVNIISAPAEIIDSNATARTFNERESPVSDSVFNYTDTASIRSSIVPISRRLLGFKIAIIGLGGTGSYILDFLSKMPIREIHLFDDDVFSQHNAFRCPSAASFDDFEKHKKVDYLSAKYKAMHKYVIPHSCKIGENNLAELDDMGFVFICIDNGVAKSPIAKHLEVKEIDFIDVGMEAIEQKGKIGGMLQVVASSQDKREHFWNRASISDGTENDLYSQNIQIAELNALNAVLAVIKWKKMVGFYYDSDYEFFSVYTIDDNSIANEEKKL